MKNVKLGTKLLGGFLIVAAVLLVVGVLGYRSVRTMETKTTAIVQAAPLIDAAMEMKTAVASDMQGIMELLAAEDQEALDEVWNEHQGNIQAFDTFADAILEGAETDEGTIYATQDEGLKEIVKEADRFHNDEFQPRMKSIYDGKVQEFAALNALEEAMGEFEVAFDKVIAAAEDFEGQVKDQIETRLSAGATAEEILSVESTWADMAMEIKTTLAVSRIKIEEYAQGFEAGALAELESEYGDMLDEFDAWIDALLNGAVTAEGTIAAITDTELRNLALEMDRIHDEEYQASATEFMDQQKAIIDIRNSMSTYGVEADAIGGQMTTMLGDVEEAAKGEIDTAMNESEKAASAASTQSIGGIVIGFLLALGIGFVLSRSISNPIIFITDLATRLAIGDAALAGLDEKKKNSIESGGDELGAIARAFASLIDYFTEMADAAQSLAEGDLTADVLPKAEVDLLGNSFKQMIANLRNLNERAKQAVIVEERERLARELHDSVTQSLYSLVLLAGGGKRYAAAGDVDESVKHLSLIGEGAHQALMEMRLLVHELRPPALEEEGLVGALQKRLDAVEGRANINARLLVDDLDDLPPYLEENLYRIAQESLNNSLKHAQAGSVVVRLSSSNGRVELEVWDDGIGFDPDATALDSGLGLVSMQERAERLGGALIINSAPNEGARVLVNVERREES